MTQSPRPQSSSVEGEAGESSDIEFVYRALALAGEDEAHDLRDLFRLDEFVRLDVRPHLLDHLSGDSARRDQVHPDSERLHFLGEDLREPGQGMLG